MKINDEYADNSAEINKVPLDCPVSTGNIVSVYTGIAILLAMKKPWAWKP